jgi:hypothetical protein
LNMRNDVRSSDSFSAIFSVTDGVRSQDIVNQRNMKEHEFNAILLYSKNNVHLLFFTVKNIKFS